MLSMTAIPMSEIAALCKRFEVRELSLFGSALRDDFRPDSDVDILVSFEPQARVSFFTLSDLQGELETVFGRKVDLVPKEGLKRMIRDEVLASSKVIYAV